MATKPLQTTKWPRLADHLRHGAALIEAQLEAERERLALWLPVALGTGIAAWFALPLRALWLGFCLCCLGAGFAGLAIGWQRRTGRALAVGATVMLLGFGLVWGRASWVAAPVLAGPVTTAFSGRVERVEPLPARDQLRFVVRPAARPDLPLRLRLSVAIDRAAGIEPGAAIGVRARLMPPPGPALPGAYGFSQRAWFDRLGGVGTVLGTPSLADRPGHGAPLRQRLSAHVQAQVGGPAGGIAAALVTGDRGAISDADADAMRRSGLAHLLSISGLHVTAVVGFVMLLLLRLLALNERLALRGTVLFWAAAGGALAGVGYTWLTGAEVPTIRSCVAALLVLLALLLGREALTLRLVAAGALIVLLWRPESLVGPSFQLSFAAVTAIVALHEGRWMRAFLARRDEGWLRRLVRGMAGLLLTGIAVEATLAPIALFHFHKAGLYGALANMVAIPLTTFVIMPAEGLGLMFDGIGLGAPFWWVARVALDALLALAHTVAATPGAVAMLPIFPAAGFALVVAGGLWALLWRTGWRWAGLAPVIFGMLTLLLQPRPDVLVTGDGRHVAARVAAGGYALLRDRAGDYVRDSLNEAAGTDGDLGLLSDRDDAECNRDFCRWEQQARDGRRFTILAGRGRDRIEPADLVAACAATDIVISDRWLGGDCRARWLTIDRDSLAESGGLAIYLAPPHLRRALDPGDEHPWRRPQQLSGNDEAIPTTAPEP